MGVNIISVINGWSARPAFTGKAYLYEYGTAAPQTFHICYFNATWFTWPAEGLRKHFVHSKCTSRDTELSNNTPQKTVWLPRYAI